MGDEPGRPAVQPKPVRPAFLLPQLPASGLHLVPLAQLNGHHTAY